MQAVSYAPKVLVIEDEPDLLDALVTYLNLDGFVADGVASLGAADSWLRTHQLDMLVLDLGLPDGDGLHWLAANRVGRDCGVVVMTARGEDAQRIEGIRAGADIYLVKPAPLEELASLLHNLWRRLSVRAQPVWLLHATGWTLQSPLGAKVKLTHSELAFLQRLAVQPGHPVARDLLVQALGQSPDTYDYRRMEILVRRLRNKVRESLAQDLPVETVHRLGYAFTGQLLLS